MSPVGHLAVSYLVSKISRKVSLPALMVGGVLPDIDYVFLFSSSFNQIHRVFTHSILFAVVSAIVGGLICRGRNVIIAGSLFFGISLHLFIDSCMDANPFNGIGIYLLWPFYKNPISPFNLLRPVETAVSWAEPAAILPMLIWESPFYLAALIVLLRAWQSKGGKFSWFT